MTPLFQTIVDDLALALREGLIQAGERLPSENELARRYRVSRITSKKALDMLAQTGRVERVRGKGTFALAAGSKPLHPEDHLIGFVLPDFSEVYGLELLQAIEAQAQACGAHLIIKRTLGDAERETQAIRALLRLGVRGLIIFPVHGEHYNPEVLRLALEGFPVVLVDRYLRGVPACSIYTDNRQAASALTAHVLTEGRRHVAFVSPPVEYTSAIEDRLLGFETALARRGLVPAGMLTLYSSLPASFTAENIRADTQRVEAFIGAHDEVDAFVASEYNLAVVLAQTLVRVGKHVPEEVAVACFDAPPKPFQESLFTHIQQDETGMGRAAVERLLQQLAGERLTGAYPLAFRLVEGRSTRRAHPYVNVTPGDIAALQLLPGAGLG